MVMLVKSVCGTKNGKLVKKEILILTNKSKIKFYYNSTWHDTSFASCYASVVQMPHQQPTQLMILQLSRKV